MLDSLLSAGLKLFGGFLGKSSQDKANTIAQQNADRQIALQREFAQNSIQWRAEDAKKAGIHPIYALGASPMSFSPVSVGVSGRDPLAESLGDMGQDISRAAGAYKTRVSRQVTGDAVMANKLQLENMSLQNDLLRQRIAQLNAPGTPPGVAFEVPEKKKPEERPPLNWYGRWLTNPHRSPGQAWEDQYGDDGVMTALSIPMFLDDAMWNVFSRFPSRGQLRKGMRDYYRNLERR